MTKFLIEQRDPRPFKNEIIQMWNDLLSGTPESRFDWLMQGNPAGATQWYLAFLEEGKELVGILSIMPKRFYCQEEELRGGVLGDFMIKKPYRVFGPAVALMKAAVSNMKNLGFDFLYSVPNPDALKVMERAGMSIEKDVGCNGLPIDYGYYLTKKIPVGVVGIASFLSDQLVRLYCREPLIRISGIFEEIKAAGNSFDTLWEKKKKMEIMAGDVSSAYIQWRYIDNPAGNFHVYTYRSGKDEDLAGYVVFSQENGKIEIYDIYAFQHRDILKLQKMVIQLARESTCQAIYFSVAVDGFLKKSISRLLPFDFHSNYEVITAGTKGKEIFSKWDFVAGDRNL